MSVFHPDTLEEAKRVIKRVEELNPAWEFESFSDDVKDLHISSMSYKSPDGILVKLEIAWRVGYREKPYPGFNYARITIYKLEGERSFNIYDNTFPGHPKNDAHEYLKDYWAKLYRDKTAPITEEIRAKTEKARLDFWGKG